MLKTLELLVFAVCLGGALSAQGERRPPRVDMSLFTGAFDLEEVEFDPEGSPGDFERGVERDRTGARFAFGRESARGFFQFFAEEIDPDVSFPAGMGLDFDTIETLGFGGGVRGVPRVNGADANLGFLIPYGANLSVAYGFEEEQDIDLSLVYFELHAEVGFALEWCGIRPSVGVQYSSFSGAMIFDEDLDLFGDTDNDDDEIELTGSQVGTFVEIAYKHPDFPMYARLRAGGGDYDAAEIVVGATW